MTEFVRIEAAPEHRQNFARWCLSQTPRLETSGSNTTDVPLDLYPLLPVELLEGSYVDGYLYNGPEVPQPEQVTADEPPSVSVTETSSDEAEESGGTETQAENVAQTISTTQERTPRTRRRAGKADT